MTIDGSLGTRAAFDDTGFGHRCKLQTQTRTRLRPRDGKLRVATGHEPLAEGFQADASRLAMRGHRLT